MLRLGRPNRTPLFIITGDVTRSRERDAVARYTHTNNNPKNARVSWIRSARGGSDDGTFGYPVAIPSVCAVWTDGCWPVCVCRWMMCFVILWPAQGQRDVPPELGEIECGREKEFVQLFVCLVLG